MNRKRCYTTIVAIVFVLCITLTGCGKINEYSETSNETTTPKEDSSKAVVNDENSVYAKVTAVDGNKLTIAYGEMATKNRGGKDDSVGKDGSSGKVDANGVERQRPSAKPDDKSMKSPFTENGETEVLTITDESIIQKRSGQETVQGTLTDIETDTYLKIEYKEDGKTINSITIMSMGQGGQNAQSGSFKQETDGDKNSVNTTE